jgi:hypothetical protein
MISKEQLSELFEGKLDALSNELNEKAESKIAGIVGEMSEALLTEMTPGHKAMMAQHLDNVEVIDYTDEFGKPTKPKKTQDSRIKNIKRPDDRDAYNQLNDFAASKSGKDTNFVGKKYTTNERALRAEELQQIEEGKIANTYHVANPERKIVFTGSHSKALKKYNELRQGDDKELGTAKHSMFHTLVKNKFVKEDVEPLEELSKATLGRYIKKSSHDVATKSAGVARYAERSNKSLDAMKNSGNYSGYTQAKADSALSDKLFKKSWKRREGIAKATDKLVAKGDE